MSLPTEIRPDAPEAELGAALASLRARRGELASRLREVGALLFRGFPLRTAQDFDAFVRCFDYRNFPYRGSLSNAVRRSFTSRVFSANEAPPEAMIRLHHELAQTPAHPSHLFFFCESPADWGGETQLCRSDRLYDALARERPGFLRGCETHGLRYHLVMPPEDDAGSGQGRSWRSTFGVDDRAGAEARLRSLGYAWEWLEGECLRATTPVLPAVRELEPGRRRFFNQLIATSGWSDARNESSRRVSRGDGAPLDEEALAVAAELAESLSVDLAWRAEDVALVDNLVVMHGRRSFRGERRVLASLAAEA